ncbi:putative Flap endonuclease 1 [Cryptosporidium serpentis]
MGIKGLARFLADNAPKSIQQQSIDSLIGRTIAIDASMWMYQFLAAIREGNQWGNLTNEAGESTSHISGMLSRTIRLLEAGIKPVFVFDGEPPELKMEELMKRKERREKAQQELEKAQEEGDTETIRKQSIRTIKVTKEQSDDVKYMLKLLGIPVIEATSEAEAQCAELCKEGIVYGVATEDADSLTFGTPLVIRHLNFSDGKPFDSKGNSKNSLQIIKLSTVLSDLGLSMQQFVDLCILCGCDYCGTIRGIGTLTAYKLLKKHKDIETIINELDKNKHPLPMSFDYVKVRELFTNPDVIKAREFKDKLKWINPNLEGLSEWLIKQQNFSEVRVANYCTRIKKSKGKTAQTSLDSFFTLTPKKISENKNKEKEVTKTQELKKTISNINKDTRKDSVSEWGEIKTKIIDIKEDKLDFEQRDKIIQEDKINFKKEFDYNEKLQSNSTAENTPIIDNKAKDLSIKKRRINRVIYDE